MDNDDELTVNALYEVVKVINSNNSDFIYSDEDKIEADGKYTTPHYKSDYSRELFYSQNYINHLTVIKKSLIIKVGGWEEGLEGAQDYDLYLKVLEITNKIYHIPEVLYHWRKIPGSTAQSMDEKSYAQEAGLSALNNHLIRRNISANVTSGKYPGTYRVLYNLKDKPLISIIIPFKDKPKLLETCVNSIIQKSTYSNYEIICISNNSNNKDTFETIKKLKENNKVKIYEYNIPFNFSKINNYAINKFAKGEHVILLNNDIEIISKEWIENLLSFSQLKEVGVVGAKLYYPNDTIQHAGIIVGIGGVAGHSHKYFDKEDHGYFCRPHLNQNLSAVTAACFMVKKEIYSKVNGLDEENLPVAFNDVDFCLRVQEKGYKNVYTPYCEAYHHESISRGQEDDMEKVKRFNKELKYMQERHKRILCSGDNYYNKYLSLVKEDFSLR